MTKQPKTYSESPNQMERALFQIAKRAWLREQIEEWDAPDPPPEPASGEAWYADPPEVPRHLVGVSAPSDIGTSVKIDPSAAELSKAFSPRPYLIVSNTLLLDLGIAWVCPLVSDLRVRPGAAKPDWAVELPELSKRNKRSHCLCAKIHSIVTAPCEDPAERALLKPLRPITTGSELNVRRAILRYIEGNAAPERDALPPGSIVSKDGVDLVVIASCDLSVCFRNGGVISTLVPLESTEPLLMRSGHPYPSFVPVIGATGHARSEFLDLAAVRTIEQRSLMRLRNGRRPELVDAARSAFKRLLLGNDVADSSEGEEVAGGAPPKQEST